MTIGLVGQDQISTFTLPVNGASPVDANTVRGQDNTIKTAFNTHDSDATIHFQSSLNAARPTAVAAGLGAKWIDNDTYRVYYSDGAAWHEIAYLSTAGGVVTGAVTAPSFILTGTGAIVSRSGASTSAVFVTLANTSGEFTAGTEGAGPGTIITGDSAYDTAIRGASGIALSANGGSTMHVRIASTGAVTLSSTLIGTRLIGGTDPAASVAPGVFSDGTAPANNAYAPANVLSLLVSKANALTTGGLVTAEVYHKQTAANPLGSIISHFSYIDSAHTSGTSLIHIANVASIEASGSGGTTTTLGCYRTQSLVQSGATITNMPLVDIRPPANSGTIGTLIGLDVQAMTAGSTANYAIRTSTGTVQFADTLELTAAATARTGSVVGLGGTTQTTIGANGAASALTANPLGYLIFFKGSTKCVIPYYNG